MPLQKCPEMAGPRGAGMPPRHSAFEELEHACIQPPYDVLLCLPHNEKGKMCFVTIITHLNKPAFLCLILESSTITGCSAHEISCCLPSCTQKLFGKVLFCTGRKHTHVYSNELALWTIKVQCPKAFSSAF